MDELEKSKKPNFEVLDDEETQDDGQNTLEKETDSSKVNEDNNSSAPLNEEKKKFLFKKKSDEELSEEALIKRKAKEQEKAEKKKALDIERRMIQLNKEESKQKALEEKMTRDREKNAVKAKNRAKKLASKRQRNLKLVERFDTDIEQGLSDDQVSQRISEGLANYRAKSGSKTYTQIILGNLLTFFNILGIVIAGFLISVGAFKDLVFMLIITLNMLIGIIQEISAKKQIDRLSLISAPTVSVLRNGSYLDINTDDVVLDDIVIFEAGKQICTDAIIVEGSIEVNESLLTGESDAILKKAGDQLYSGSYVVSGNCKARVDKVGKDNYIESLTQSAKQYVKPKSEILHALNIIIQVMAFVIVVIGVTLFFVQWKGNGMSYSESIRKTAGAMIGMVPSGLYLVTSGGLAVGVLRLAEKNVLVQELYCIEMLARINVLCLDKTGTITDGSMVVRDFIEYNNPNGLTTKHIISAMLNATNDNNLTNQALESKFGKAKRLKSNAVIPFSSKRKYSAVTFDQLGTYVLGAPEFVLKKDFYKVSKDVDKFTKEGFRVLLLAHMKESIEDDLLPEIEPSPCSLILIQDNVRQDAIDTIKYFKESGVEVKVISGDNPMTVCMIAKRAGIENAEKFISLDGLSEQEVVYAATRYTVFGRVSPAQKRLLIKTLKEEGNTVAMTGDGVNDILALKEADCSIAIASGSEAARNVSHLVLVDSNFNSMPSVVAEGRRIINNITKVARLYLTKTIFSLLLAIEALISGYYPISTSQLFMIDLFCIGIPSVVLVLEKNNELNKGKFLTNVIKSALPGAIVILILSLIVFSLQVPLNMTTRISSTLIIITATFTCLMVLFDVCSKPFTRVHKILFYSLFSVTVFLTIMFPKFFEFSPLFPFGKYYDENEETITYTTPQVSISNANNYIIDGYVLSDYYVPIQTTTHTISLVDGEILLDGVTRVSTHDYTPELLDVSVTNDLKYALGGFVTDIDFDSNKTVTFNNSGDVYYGETKVPYNIFPSVTVDANGYYIINKKIVTTVQSPSRNVGKVTLDGCDVYVDNEKIYTLYQGVGLPFGHNQNNKLVVDQQVSSIECPENYDLSQTVVTVRGSNYFIDDAETTIVYSPEITVTKAGYYIIDGYITEYSCDGNYQIMSLNLSEDYYLKINGIKTNYKVTDFKKTVGADVQTLPLNCTILLLMLCFLALPLMKFVNGVVPFVKRWIGIIVNVINKL